MFVSPPYPDSYVEILMPNLMVLGGGAFGRCLGHEGGSLTNGNIVLIKETPQRSLVASTMRGHSEKVLAVNLHEGPHQNSAMLVPRSWTSHPPEL